METPECCLALGRAMLAVAWADGELSTREVETIHGLLKPQPGFAPSVWDQLAIQRNNPLSEGHLVVYLELLRDQLQDDASRGIAKQCLIQVLIADGVITPERREAQQLLANLLSDETTPAWASTLRLLRAPAG